MTTFADLSTTEQVQRALPLAREILIGHGINCDPRPGDEDIISRLALLTGDEDLHDIGDRMTDDQYGACFAVGSSPRRRSASRSVCCCGQRRLGSAVRDECRNTLKEGTGSAGAGAHRCGSLLRRARGRPAL